MTIGTDVSNLRLDSAPPSAKRVASDLARLVGLALVCGLALGLLLTAAAVAVPAPLDEGGDSGSAPSLEPSDAACGTFLMRRRLDEIWAAAPTLTTRASFRVSGVVARTSVVQRFRNTTDEWVEGIYVFPLPEAAAVDHLRMVVGERVVEGQIRERGQARAEYRRARATGRRASLIEQERPNIFTSTVANLGPGEELVVEIEFQQTLTFDEGEVRLRFPLVVGPRYIPGRVADQSPLGAGWAHDTNEVPDASRITPPVYPASDQLRNPVEIEVELDAGFPVEALRSRSHDVEITSYDERRHRVRLRDEAVPADRDFVLAWAPQPGAMPRSALFTEERDGVTYALLTLFPPVGPAVETSRLPREVVYVIDTSGSMNGLSIQQARKALLLAIDRMRAGDRFNVVQFNSVTRALFARAERVTPESRSAARDWVGGLAANGGTEMAAALEAALVGSDDPGLVRQVVFLTDGSVGNEERLFRIIHARLGDTRLFTVGIGSAPNGHFMTKAAEFGHGTFTYIGDVREVEQKMNRLFSALENPVLTGIDVQWPTGAAVESWPQRIPDLYLGAPLVVTARLEGGLGRAVVAGRRGGEAWQVELPLTQDRRGEGVAVLWARRKVQSLLDSLHEGADADDVRAAVVALGVEHHLVTPHTSLVAVDVTPARPEGAALRSGAVPTNLPHGWRRAAVFGELPRTATSAPLHLLVALLAALLGALLVRLGGRRAEGARW